MLSFLTDFQLDRNGEKISQVINTLSAILNIDCLFFN